ncbi:MAG: hypothetical protein J2P36_03485 [Ktedonobacteraceae bacterium]|nr:hypothetical protein [Ktedonobacteraceae bacterium]
MTDLQSIYRLFDPRTQETRYIGISSDVNSRYQQHLADTTVCLKTEWIRGLRASGLLPSIEILEADLPPVLAGEREKYWIQHFLGQGAMLTNRQIWTPINQNNVVSTAILEEKPIYTRQELFHCLPIRLIDLSRESGIHESTLRNIWAGKPAHTHNINKLLLTLSKIYGRTLSIENVTGMERVRKQRLVRK